MNKFFAIGFYVLLLAGCTSQNKPARELTKPIEKIHGANFVSVPNTVTAADFEPLAAIGANWVSIVPFGYIERNSAKVIFNSPMQWQGETLNGCKQYILAAREKGLKIFLKPHLWPHDDWVGNLEFTTEEEWETFESTYRDYILAFAKLADSMQVELFCIGVELRKSVVQRPTYWKNLIQEIKKTYRGKLTYAANWDNYTNVSFWNLVDYIGIDAYFPVSDKQTPSVNDCIAGWGNTKEDLKNLSKTLKKPLLFTEYGYRNTDYTGKSPWVDTYDPSNNTEAQANTYQAIFDVFWNESWFAGGFLWKWFPNHPKAGGLNDNQFTPQNKLAQKVIENQFKGIK